ncbi:heterokaryon incompatibility protein-domain-containing protein [Xylaria intraflava]|nr:heterokaryon incompatibility protein-domain-containing protein [Xylaria intraflava]
MISAQASVHGLAEATCDLCDGINLSDEIFGGYERTSADGRKYLDPDLKKASIRNKYTGKHEFFLDHFKIWDSFPGLPILAESVRNGCAFCKFLKEIFDSDEIAYLLDDAMPEAKNVSGPIGIYAYYVWDASASHPGLDGLRLRAHFDCEENWIVENQGVCEITVRVTAAYDAAQTDIVSWLRLPSVQPPVTSKEIVNWTIDELANCVHQQGEHKECESYLATHYFVPTRLIDLRMETLRLVNREDLLAAGTTTGEEIQYTALSYCWGSDTDAGLQLKTTSRSLADRMAGFLIADLPQAIQDAVIFTRALGINYLWVDSICIIQDELEDWNREAAQLAHIYGCAYVTLCSLTPSCRIGFLCPKYPQITTTFRSSISSDITGDLLFQFESCSMIGAGREAWIDRVPESRWFSRGWTFQESMMATRAILFGNLNAILICPTKEIAMMGPSKDRGFLSLEDLSIMNKEMLYQTWWQSVAARYSDRQFTYPHDILPALSGLAKVFEERLDDMYVAGLWRSNLACGLSWYHHREVGPQHNSLPELLSALTNRDSYIAPSWSWAGRRCLEFGIPGGQIHEDCRVLAISLAGRVQSTFEAAKRWKLTMNGHAVAINPWTPITYEEQGHISLLSLFQGAKVRCNFDFYMGDSTRTTGKLKLLLLGRSFNYPDETGQQFPNPNRGCRQTTESAFGLIIHPAKTSGSFLRVGYFRSVDHEGVWKQFKESARETISII